MEDYSKLSDSELLRDNPSDSGKIAELISRYMKTVFAGARKFSQFADYEELVSDGMQGLLAAVSNYDSEKGEFSAFAAVCINNRLRNTAKKSSLRRKNLAAEEEMREIPDKNPTPEEAVIEKENSEDVRKSLKAELSDLELHCIECAAMGMSYAETAKRLGVDKKSVDNALSRARAKVRRIMGGNL